METISTRCCIAGGGPAGMTLGYLLARAGVDVVVLEKHGDFLRDFRGDTIHPSTLEIMYELNLLEEFLKLPHRKLREIGAQIGLFAVTLGDLTHLPTHCKFLAVMPQWDFLNFLAARARRFPSFRLLMNTEAIGLIEEGGVIRGVRAKTEDGPLEIRADLVIAADGRRSLLRDQAGFSAVDLGAPMDVVWMRLPRSPGDPGQSFGRIGIGQFLVLIDRGDYWQCAYLIPKGTFDSFRAQGLPALRDALVRIAPFFHDRVDQIQTWEQISFLSVTVNRLDQWSRPGLLCIGDAAHAMSPIAGVGINLAIQDAVAAANALASSLAKGAVPLAILEKVRERRMFPTRATQAVQIFIQNRMVSPVLSGATELRSLPLFFRLLNVFPLLRRIPARIIGLGFRPEHVHTPAV
jgi:2-polyprenyl-6-methoxyphenol hydroxylase-like FAD-dependent oxidoreductase